MLSRKLAPPLVLAVLAGLIFASCGSPGLNASPQPLPVKVDVTRTLQQDAGLYHFLARTDAQGRISSVVLVHGFLHPTRKRVVIPEQGMQPGLRMEDYAWPVLTSTQEPVVGLAEPLPLHQVYRTADGTTVVQDDAALGRAGNNLFGEAIYHATLPDGFVFTPGAATQPVRVQLAAHDVSGMPVATVLQGYVAQAGGLERFALDRLVAGSGARMPPGAMIYTERFTYGADQILFQPDPQERTLPDIDTLGLQGGHLLEVSGWNGTRPRLVFDADASHPEDAWWESLTGYGADGRVYRAEYDRAGSTITRMPAFNHVAAMAIAAAVKRGWQPDQILALAPARH
ncbi:hypothetical protein [Silvimonas iriomotensis]|uniref:Uncharacterized protein n=1 Tax=Silvimonas iriomotensis TaxID=449662 RepID=A0ABQ2P450_9NEIS|nr:hypothetical protein [Silvimonas iriomotensis]GGP17837.1 hypothetical protein GCM10010970_01800 [Silvimonas iriomotensis]